MSSRLFTRTFCARERCPVRTRVAATPVDEHLGAGHETALIRCEKNDRRSDFVGPTDTAHRHAGGLAVQQRLLLVAGRKSSEAGSLDGARNHGVDADLPVHQFGRPRATQRADGRFRCRVGTECWNTRVGRCGTGEHDRGALVQKRQYRLEGEHRATDVAVQRVGEMLRRLVLQSRELSTARVGEDDVEALAALPDRSGETQQIGRVGDVALDTGGGVTDRRHGIVDPALPATGDEHVRALGRESLGCCQADARRAAGHQSSLSAELVHGSSSIVESWYRDATW